MFNRSKKQKEQNKKYVSALKKDFQSRLGAFRENRTSNAQEVLISDFNQVLIAWGIENKADIPNIIRELRLRCLIFAVPLLVSIIFVLFVQNFALYLYYYMALVCFILPCVLGIITTCWRVSVLKHRQFVSLPRWLCSTLLLR